MIAAIEQAVAEAREQLGPGLIAVEVWDSRTGLGYYQSNPATAAMLNTAICDLKVALAAGNSGELDDWVVLDLDDRTVVVMLCPPLLEAALILDTAAVDLTDVLTRTVPDLVARFRSVQNKTREPGPLTEAAARAPRCGSRRLGDTTDSLQLGSTRLGAGTAWLHFSRHCPVPNNERGAVDRAIPIRITIIEKAGSSPGGIQPSRSARRAS